MKTKIDLTLILPIRKLNIDFSHLLKLHLSSKIHGLSSLVPLPEIKEMIDPALNDQLTSFQRKFFYNKLLRGSLIFIALTGAYCILIAGFESFIRPGSLIRAVLLVLSLLFLVASLWGFVIRHLLALLRPKHHLTDDQAAHLIGQQFSNIGDRLINTLQLQRLVHDKVGLAQASIDQRALEFHKYSFEQAINLKLNGKYLYFTLPIALLFIGLGQLLPGIYADSSTRIINYNQFYATPAPFEFVLLSKNLEVFKNESLLLELALNGNEVPDLCYILIEDQKIRMKPEQNGQFSYLFETVPNDLNFSFLSAGYQSISYTITTKVKPELINFNIQLEYPTHTQKKPEILFNNGNLNLPEHTQVSWNISCFDTDSVQIVIGDYPALLATYMPDNQLFNFKYSVIKSDSYEIILANEHGRNQESIKYQITVLKDLFPELEVNFFIDTLYYDFVLITGTFSDDYGIHSLMIDQKGGVDTLIMLPFKNIPNSQSFYQQVPITSDMIGQQTQIELQVILTDNDLPNGYKSTFSTPFYLKIPDDKHFKSLLSSKTKASESGIKELISKNESLQEKLLNIEEKLKMKKTLDWQDHSLFEEILKEKQQLAEALKEMAKKMEELNQQQNKFSDKDQALQKKSAQLKELISNVLDEETKKLFDELEQLLKEQQNVKDIQKKLSSLTNKEENIEQELNRALELFKRLKLENDLDQAQKMIQKLSQEQKELSKESGKKDLPLEDLKKQQSEITQKFGEFKRDLDNLESLNQELKRPESLSPTQSSEDNIDESLQEIADALEEKQRKKAGKKQEETSEEMKDLSERLASMQSNMETETLNENIEDLNRILDDLIKLSFEQETIMKSFRGLKPMDPRFVSLSQEQLKLKDNIAVLSDSLLALSERVVAISSFVTSELSELNRNISASILSLRQRKANSAVVNQQYSMTSMNNLALLLNDLLQQMRDQANSQGSGKPRNQPSGGLPNLRQLQKQLSKQIQQLKKGGLTGRELSQELAEMAARQEMIRNELNKLNNKLKGQPGNENANNHLSEAAKEMEKNELNLINKQITQELINRQEKILTRMLDADNALQNQDEDERREAERAQNYKSRRPPALENYLKEKSKEIELLESIPVNLHPFYKAEVNEYFKRIREKEKN